MENVFLDVECENDVFGNRLEFVLPRMTYLLDNNNFQTALYSKPFCMMMFLERSVYFWTGVVLQNTGMMHLQHMQMHVDVDEFIFVFCFSWNLQQTLENNVHVCTCLVQACCTTETKRESTTSTVASSLTTFFGCFVCVREKGESELKLWN